MALVACAPLVASRAAAEPSPEKVACARAYEGAQRLREAHHLLAAREALLACMSAECPTVLRRDCAVWLGETDAATPSVIIVARGPDGRPQADVHVSIDGASVGDRSTATPIAVDPGEHVLRFEMDGAARIEERVTLREGERERRIDVTFNALPAKPTAPEAPPPRRERGTPPPTLAYALGGAGLVVGALGAYFQVSGMSKRSALDACAPHCAQADVDDARRSIWIGNVALWVGVSSLAVAAILFIAHSSAQAAP